MIEINPNIVYTPVMANGGEGRNRERLQQVLEQDLAEEDSKLTSRARRNWLTASRKSW